MAIQEDQAGELGLLLRVAAVWCSLVQRPFFPNPKLDPGPVQAPRPDPEPPRGPVQFRSDSGPDMAEPQTLPQTHTKSH